jgi:hypothetical protein
MTQDFKKMKNFLFLFVLYGLPVVILSLNCTHTNDDEKGPQKNKACVFPFTVKNKSEEFTYDSCTRNHDPDSKLWCSTKVSPDGYHVAFEKEWGYCDPGNKMISACTFLKVKKYSLPNLFFRLTKDLLQN